MPHKIQTELYRELPSIDELLRSPDLALQVAQYGLRAVTEAGRAVIERLRREITEGKLDAAELGRELGRIAGIVTLELRQSFSFSLRPVINATGVVLHTNLGRSPLSSDALTHIRETAAGYSNLEFDLATGERGKRDVHVQRLFQSLLGRYVRPDSPISTVVVNNCAAAVMLALNTLAEGGEVVVSRGELVEIGGSFRVPEIMTKSGAVLREVGTTNRTRLSDYERAITERTRLLLRVHRSNFAIVGFTEQPSLEELAALGRRHKIPVMEDLGNGALFDLEEVGIKRESGVIQSLRANIDLVVYSGDKLMGGPQSGMITGGPEIVGRIRSNPLFRALRVDKLVYAALEATLLAYLRGDYDSIPALRMIRMPAQEIRRRAEKIAATIADLHQLTVDIMSDESVIGGGTAPTATLPTFVLAVSSSKLPAPELQRRLREQQFPVIARVEEDRVLFDLRTVFPEQDEALVASLRAIAGT